MRPVVIGDNLLNFSEDQSAPLRVTEGCYSATVSGVAVPPDKGDDWDGGLIFRFRITAGPVGYAVPEGIGQGTSIYCSLADSGLFKFGQTLAGIGFPRDVLERVIKGAKIGTTTEDAYGALKVYAANIAAKVTGVKVGLQIIDSTYKQGTSEVFQVIKYAAYEDLAKLVPTTAFTVPAAVASSPISPATAAAPAPTAAPAPNGQADLAATVAASLDSFAL